MTVLLQAHGLPARPLVGGVYLIDYFFAGVGDYAITDLFRPGGVYGLWVWRGLRVLLRLWPAARCCPSSPSASTRDRPSTAMNGVDIAVFVGLLVSGAGYLLLMRSADLSAEPPAVARSDQELGRRSSEHVALRRTRVRLPASPTKESTMRTDPAIELDRNGVRRRAPP